MTLPRAPHSSLAQGPARPYGNLLRALVFLLPVGAWLALIALVMDANRRFVALRLEDHRHAWEQDARTIAAFLQRAHTLEAQVEDRGRQMIRRMERTLRQDRARRPDAALVGTSIREAFPEISPGAGLRVWGFAGDPRAGEVETLVGPGLEARTRAVAAAVFRGLAILAGGGTLRPEAHHRLRKQTAALFGPLAKPELLADVREKRLTEVLVEGRFAYLWWSRIRQRGRVVGGMVVVFPANLAQRIRPRQAALEQAWRRSRGRVLPLLLPLAAARGRPVLLPTSCRRAQGAREQARRALHLTRSGLLLQNRLLEQGDTWWLSAFLSMDTPHHTVLVGAVPRLSGPLAGWPRGLALLGLGVVAWTLLQGSQTGRAESLRTSFLSMFLALALLPLAAVGLYGAFQIEAGEAQQIRRIRQEAVEEAQRIDFSGDTILQELSMITYRLGEDPRIREALLSSSRPRRESALRRLDAVCGAKGVGVDDLMLMAPGRSPVLLYGRGQTRKTSRRTQEFLSVICYRFHQIIHELFHPAPAALGVTPAVKKALDVLRLLDTPVVVKMFYAAHEVGEISRTGQDDPIFTMVQTLADGGTLQAYLLLTTRAAALFQRHLEQAVRRTNIDRQGFLGYGLSDPRRGFSVPNRDHGPFWGSAEGHRLAALMVRAAELGAPLSTERDGTLHFALPLQRLSPFVMGGVRPLQHVRMAAFWQRTGLAGFLIVVGLVLVALAQGAGEFLLTPLTEAAQALTAVARGDLEQRMPSTRDDELGEMTRAFDQMIAGLRERRDLGRFISGSLEHSISQGNLAEGPPRAVPAAVLISDIRSFTTISESHPPAEVVAMLNAHLDAMARKIRQRGGKIDRFVGDAIIALFTAPTPAEAVHQAIEAARDMMAGHAALQEERRRGGRFPYAIGIGIDFGQIMEGTLSAGERLEYALFGPPRVEAERLEAASKSGRHTRIMVSEAVRNLATGTDPFMEHRQHRAWEIISLQRASS